MVDGENNRDGLRGRVLLRDISMDEYLYGFLENDISSWIYIKKTSEWKILPIFIKKRADFNINRQNVQIRGKIEKTTVNHNIWKPAGRKGRVSV